MRYISYISHPSLYLYLFGGSLLGSSSPLDPSKEVFRLPAESKRCLLPLIPRLGLGFPPPHPFPFIADNGLVGLEVFPAFIEFCKTVEGILKEARLFRTGI